jgi:signal transduction histidine kinase
MRNLKTSILAIAASTAIAATAYASADHGTADEATAMLSKAEAHYKSAGRDQALKDFSSKGNGWQDRDLYVFCMDPSGKNTAHGANAALAGRDLSGLKDADGKLFVAELLSTGKSGGGWVDYRWPNPTTKKVEQKSSYVKQFGDDVCGIGIYK